MNNSDPDILEFFEDTLATLRNTGREHELQVLMVILDPLLMQLVDEPLPREDLSRLKTQTSQALAQYNNFNHLRSYIFLCDSFAERGRLDGFSHACIMRSRIKILLDEFIDWHIFQSSQRDTLVHDIEDTDEIIEEISDDASPIRESDIPDWVNKDHWWWWAPKRQDMSEAERYERIHYEEL